MEVRVWIVVFIIYFFMFHVVQWGGTFLAPPLLDGDELRVYRDFCTAAYF